MKNSMIFLVLLLISWGNCTELNLCCDDGVNILLNKTCLNNTKIQILPHCRKKFIADPKDEKIEVLSNGDLSIDDLVAPKSDYCFTNIIWDNENETTAVYLFCSTTIVSIEDMHLIKGFLMIISVLFLLLTLYIYYIIPNLRQTLDKVTAFGVLTLLLFMSTVSLLQFRFIIINVTCRVIAHFAYFFTIAYFVWLQVIMINVWKLTTGRNWAIKEKTWYTINHLYVWIMATIWTIFMYFYEEKPRSGAEITCWFTTDEKHLIFVNLPLLITIIINVVLYIGIIYCLNVSGSGISLGRKKVLKYKCILYLKLFLISGIIWTFEILSFKSYHTFWLIMDCINCLQGVLVFIILIIWRQRIKRELGGTRVLCFKFPRRWTKIEDDEQETINEDDTTRNDLMVQ